MNTNFSLIPISLQNKLAVKEVLNCNEFTKRYGLNLSVVEAQKLVQTRNEILKKSGRIEFGGGIIDKLMKEFCDSPFIFQFNYIEILSDLLEIFYYFKNESLEEISDDELIVAMKIFFDNDCKGSIELLQGRELERLAHI